jgi:hypothetical protein
MYAMFTRRGDLRVARLIQEAIALPLILTDDQFAAVVRRDIARVAKRYPEVRGPAVRETIIA